MRRVVPLLLALALPLGCAAPEDEELIGTSSLQVITLGEGEWQIEMDLLPGDSQSVEIDTEFTTQMAVVAPQAIEGDAVFYTKQNDVATLENADCVGVDETTNCSYTAPGAGKLNVAATASLVGGGIARVILNIRIVEGISTSP